MSRKILIIILAVAMVICTTAVAFGDDSSSGSNAGDTTPAATQTTAAAQTTTVAQPSRYQKGLAAYIRSKNRKVSKANSLRLAGYFIKYGKKYNVDPKVLMAMAQHESSFNARAHNPAGYYGIMQTSASLGRSHGYSKKSLYKAQNSIKTAASYLRYNMRVFHNNYRKAVAGYCCGTYAVKKGHYSKRTANIRLKTRAKIGKYLTKHNYV